MPHVTIDRPNVTANEAPTRCARRSRPGLAIVTMLAVLGFLFAGVSTATAPTPGELVPDSTLKGAGAFMGLGSGLNASVTRDWVIEDFVGRFESAWAVSSLGQHEELWGRRSSCTSPCSALSADVSSAGPPSAGSSLLYARAR
jgi:hypothetical protein